MRFGPIEVAGRESSLISPLSFTRHLRELRRFGSTTIDYVSVSEHRLTSLALSGPGGILGVTAGPRLHVCRRNHHGDFRPEPWQYQNDCKLIASEWYAADGAAAIVADVSGHIRVLDVASSSVVLDVSFGPESSCTNLSMSPIDHTLFVACLAGCEGARLIDIRSGNHSQILGVSRFANNPARAATCSAWSRAVQYQCVIGRADQAVTVFDIRRPKPLYELPCKAQDRPITDLRFSCSGSNLFASSTDGRLLGWRVDGNDGLCNLTRSHAFSTLNSNCSKVVQFAISTDSVFFPESSSVSIFELFGGPGSRPKKVPIGLGELTAVLWDESDQVLYTSDDNGVIGVVRSCLGKDNTTTDPLIEWESYSDDSDIEFPSQLENSIQ